MADWKFASKDEVPEDLRGDAKEVDGKWVVSVVSKVKLAEFRDNNIAIAQERDRLKAANEAYAKLGDDPLKISGELADLRAVNQQVKDGKYKTNDAVTTEAEARSKAFRESLEAQIAELGSKLSASEARAKETDAKFKGSIVEREVTNAVMAEDSGMNPAALPDILVRAKALFQVTEEGRLVAKNGDAVVYGQDGVSSMSPKEWLGKVKVEAPYLAKQSAGGGANGGDGKGAKHGMTDAEFEKLSPVERINRARGI